MNHNLGQFIQSIRRIKLSRKEHTRMRSFLLEYMAHTPIRKRGQSFVVAWFRMHRFVVYVAALLLIVVISTGVSYAAEGTVPGDSLYPIKVAVIEPMRAAFARTPEERASWEIIRAERRLAEAETLAYTGRLTDTYRKNIEVQLGVHLERARIEAGKQEEALEDIEETVEAMLEVHEGILESLEERDGESVGALLALVRERGEKQRSDSNLLTRATDTDESQDAPQAATFSSTLESESEEVTTSERDISETKDDVSNMVSRLENIHDRLNAVTGEARKALNTLPLSTQNALERLLEEAQDAFEDAEDAYADSEREKLEEALTETSRAIRRIEAALRATIHIRRIDPELWPIDIAPRNSDDLVLPSLDDGRTTTTNGDVQGEYRERIDNDETKAEFRLRNR